MANTGQKQLTREIIDMNKIIIFEEKYGNRYFDASTPEKLNAACFKVLKERYENGEYNWLLEEAPEAINILADEQIEALPTERLKNDEIRRKKEYENKFKSWQRKQKELQDIKQCVENEAKERAFFLLRKRNSGEYEEFEIEDLEEV